MKESTPSLFRNANITYFGSCVSGLALALILYGYVDTTLLYGWLIINMLVIFLRIGLSFINPYPDDGVKNKKYRTIVLLIGIGISGVVWAAPVWLLFVHDDIVRQMFLIFVLLGLVSASPAASGSNTTASLIFSQPIIVALFLRFIYEGEQVYYIMATLLLTGDMALILTSFHFSRVYKWSVKARKEAEKASFAKSEFLANISHEVRTPMNAIMGFNYLLKQTELTQQQSDYVDSSFVASKSLLESIDNILGYSKIEKQEGKIELSSFDLWDVLHRVTTLVELDAKDKGLQFTTHIDRNTTRFLKGDSVKLVQVLSNLTKNAVKFTEQGEVELAINQIEETNVQTKTPSTKIHKNEQTKTKVLIHFSVRDTGIGIHSKDYDKIFKPFSQVNTSRNRQYTGTGLGLSISQQHVNTMGSEIEVESVPNEGSTFYFSLWFDKSSDKEYTTSPINPITDRNEEATDTNSNDMIQSVSYIQKDMSALLSLEGYEILVVEDDKLNKLVVQELLSCMGACVKVVGTAQLAFASLKKRLPDLILLDIQMPHMDGFEAITIIRSTHEWKHIPVICLTAHSNISEKEKAFSLGMNDYLNKPIDPIELHTKLMKFLPGQDSYNIKPVAKKPNPKIDLMSNSKSKKEVYRNITNVFDMLENRKSSVFIKTVIDSLETSRDSLQYDLSHHDWKGAAKCAHKLRGSANLYASSNLERCLKAIDEGLITKKNLTETLDLLDSEFGFVLDRLK